MLPVMAARVSLSPPRDTAVRSACRDKGFTVDYNKGDNYYRANNDAGWQVSIDYEGNQIMSIRIDAPDSSSGSTTSEPSPDSSTSSATAQNDGKLVNGMRKDFKEAMDSYEAFMNEYVAFMKKYNANPNDPTLMADYARYMSKYADACEIQQVGKRGHERRRDRVLHRRAGARQQKAAGSGGLTDSAGAPSKAKKSPGTDVPGGFCTGSGYPCLPFAPAQAGSALPAFSLRCGSTAATAPKSTDGSTHAKPSSNSGSLCRNVSGTP